MKNKKDKPPKNSAKRKGPESIEGKRPGERQSPATAERTDAETVPEKEPAAPPPPPGPSSTQPITNQDEQDKITNADSSDDRIADK